MNHWLQCHYDRLSDTAEWAMAQWWGGAGFALVAGFTAFLWGWDGVDRWSTIPTTILLIILINQSRRSDKATHLKLDSIDEIEEHNQLESRTEREIEEARDA